tara:strand:+ start:2153 stop:2602 length:450 start_codon:yes stop_codon:yes gene_type:complete
MNPNVRIAVGLLLVLVGFFWDNIQERIPDFVPSDNVIDVAEPTENMKEKTSFGSVVTDNKDRANLAVFNKVFSDRCVSYKTTNQQVNDVYTLAAKDFFGDSLKGKYNGYGESLTGLLKDTIGEEVHELSSEEKQKLSESFSALAWQFSN